VIAFLPALLALPFLVLAFVNVWRWPRVSLRSVAHEPSEGSLSVLIPARNEASTIEECVENVLRQGAIVREVLVYDDGSEDDTAQRVDLLHLRDPRVVLVAGSALPGGWYGKPHACMRLAEQARAPWILFLDADARLAKGAAAAILTTAVARDVTLLACWPGFLLHRAAEKMLLPMLNFFVFTIFPTVLSLRSNDERFGLAHGACILAHRETYHRLGGHLMVKSELFEDTRLARMWRSENERSLCLDGQDVVAVRMYDSMRGIWNGFVKNFFPGFRSELTFWLFLAFHALVFLVPWVMLPFSWNTEWFWGMALAVGAVLIIRLAFAFRFGFARWATLLHPLAEAFLLAGGMASWWKWKHGQGVEWRGRRYQKSALGPSSKGGFAR